MPDPDLLAIDRGTVVAPAGCGKTQLIATAVHRHGSRKPILVLTHTNAGAAALRGRLEKLGVPPRAYRVATIDGFALRLIGMFPRRSGHPPELLELRNPRHDYPAIRTAAASLLAAGHVSDLVRATHSRLIVDEYQDCSRRQHALIEAASELLPTCVLGDTMQAIFGFGLDPLADWDLDVSSHFPIAGELTTPWRWVNAGTEAFGRWLLDARTRLHRGEGLDLRAIPPEVRWVQLDGANDHELCLRAARAAPPVAGGTTLIIAESTNPGRQRQIAAQTPGAVTVENVDLGDLIAFSRTLDFGDPPGALQRVADFAHQVMTNVDPAELTRRVGSHRRGTSRTAPTDAERAAITFIGRPCADTAVDLLVELNKQVGVRPHRPAVLRASIKALNMCNEKKGVSFQDAAEQVREQQRILGRPLPKRAVGSTLLLKGLEADMSVVLNADALDRRNLYVAITRGSRSLTMCASAPLIGR